MRSKEELKIIKNELIDNLKNSHSPCSNYRVSAMLFTENGKFKGVNVEDGVQILSICAERSAIVSAISSGETNFKEMYIIAKDDKLDTFEENLIPCGYCRQYISEFVDDDFKIYIFTNNDIKEFTMGELLPYGFKL